MPISQASPLEPPQSKYDRLIARARKVNPAATLVVYPCDEPSLRGAIEAAETGIIVPTLVGPAARIQAVAREHELDIERFEIVDADHCEAAATKAVQLVHEAKGELLMKGSLHTDELMRAVMRSGTGLRTTRRISHVFIVDVPSHSEALFITDAAINISPDLDAKRDIIQNAIDLFALVGLGTPRVAILSAVETVTTKIPSTIEAAWRIEDRLRAASLMGRLPSTMRSTPRRPGSRGSSRRSPGGHKFLSCRTWKPAICLQRTSFFLPRQIRLGSFSAGAFRSS
jgi:phosphate acetyltransferase